MKLPHDVTITTPGHVTDEYGNAKVKTWSVPPAVAVQVRGFFQPRRGQENENSGDVQTGDAVVYLPASTAITGSDRVTVQGLTFEVAGPPEVWSTGSPLDHKKATLRRITD